MNQRIAVFSDCSISDMRDDIEKNMQPSERIAHISHSSAVSYDNHTNRGSGLYAYYSAIVIFEKDGGEV